MRWIAALLLFSLSLSAASITPYRSNPSMVRIVPVEPTPEPDNVQTTLVFPRRGQVVYQSPVSVQARLTGFPLGTNSDFDRAKEIYNDPMGQSLLVFLDNDHPIEIYKSFIDALDDNNLFWDLTLTTRIPYTLRPGMHVIRAFPDRSYGESLKRPGCYAVTYFFFQEEIDNLDVDLNGPYLTYNEPLETLNYNAAKPILLDFFLSNTQLSSDGFKVRVIINGDNIRDLTRWVPYYIYGLTSGKHTVRLQLIDENNKVVPGLFNDVSRTITVN